MTDWKEISAKENNKGLVYRIYKKTFYKSMRKDKNMKMGKVHEQTTESKMANKHESHLANNQRNQTETITFSHIRLANN